MLLGHCISGIETEYDCVPISLVGIQNGIGEIRVIGRIRKVLCFQCQTTISAMQVASFS